MEGKLLTSPSLPPPPTTQNRFDGVYGRPSFGFTGVIVLPFSEQDAEPLGVMEVLLKFIFFLDVLLGLEVYTPRASDGMAPLTEEEEEAWWQQWEEEMEREEEEERKRKLEEEEDYDINFWKEEEEEKEDVEDMEEEEEEEEEVEEDKEAVAREQERFLQWVEEWVEEKVGVEDGRECVQRFVCEYYHKYSLSINSSSFSSSSSSSSSSSGHPSLISYLVHTLFMPRETHGGAALDQYRAAKRIGSEAAGRGGRKGCVAAFPSCPLSVFNALGGYF